MPLYTFACTECDFTDEYFLTMAERNSVGLLCDQCGGVLKRVVDKPVIGKPAYQMQAVMASGEHIPGHFGKMAKKW